MRIAAFIVSAALFVGSILLFGYTFELPDAEGANTDLVRIGLFIVGVLGISASLAIPFHLLKKFD